MGERAKPRRDSMLAVTLQGGTTVCGIVAKTKTHRHLQNWRLCQGRVQIGGGKAAPARSAALKKYCCSSEVKSSSEFELIEAWVLATKYLSSRGAQNRRQIAQILGMHSTANGSCQRN